MGSWFGNNLACAIASIAAKQPHVSDIRIVHTTGRPATSFDGAEVFSHIGEDETSYVGFFSIHGSVRYADWDR